MSKRKPARLIEALQHIEASGSLLTMRDVQCVTIDSLWRYIQSNRLAKLTMKSDPLWVLTDAGRTLLPTTVNSVTE